MCWDGLSKYDRWKYQINRSVHLVLFFLVDSKLAMSFDLPKGIFRHLTSFLFDRQRFEWLSSLHSCNGLIRVCHSPLFVTFFFRKCFICSSEVLGCQGYFCFCSSICIKVPSKPILIFQFFENLQYLNNLKWP